jgi:ankyrin repeat protein
MTALHLAAGAHKDEMVRFLLENGADIHATAHVSYQ